MIRIVTRLIGILVVLLCLAVGAVFLLPKDRIAQIASDQISAVSGRSVVFEDGLSPQLFPNLGVRSGAFRIEGDGSGAPLLSGDSLLIVVDLGALFGGQIRVREILMDGAELSLVQQADGSANWQSPGGGGTPSAGGAGPDLSGFSLDQLRLTNATVRYTDATGADFALTGAELSTAVPDPSQPVQLSLAGVANGQPVEADVTVSSLVDLMQGAGVGVDLRLSQGDNVVSFDGALGSDGALNGGLGLSFPQVGRVLAMAGQSGDLLPAEILPIDLSAQLSVTPTAIGMSTAQIRLGRNRVAGDLTLALSEVPKLTGLLSADALDVSFLSNAQSQGGAGAASGGGWSTDPIDASGLSALDADITVVANQIDFGETLTQNARLQVTIDRARMVAQLLQAEAFGGALTGRFVANNRNGLSVGGQMQGRTVAVNALLTDLAGFERLGGVGDAELEFLGVGGSLDSIMKSLSGAGRITVNDGALRGFDLEAMMRGDTTISDAATTIFQNMSASFTIDGGVLSNQDLAVAARVLSATGAGRIDLGRQTLDYVLTPRLTGIEETGAISLPVKISGPWASPSILPDLEALARQQLEIDAARLEEEARARLAAEKAEAAERLAQEEERLRQRLQQEQDRLEDRARGALRGLLGGN